MRMVVLLPAPLGPRNPTICPLGTSKLTRSTARTWPYAFVRSLTEITDQFLRTPAPRWHSAPKPPPPPADFMRCPPTCCNRNGPPAIPVRPATQVEPAILLARGRKLK